MDHDLWIDLRNLPHAFPGAGDVFLVAKLKERVFKVKVNVPEVDPDASVALN